MVKLDMGPNQLWLMETITRDLDLRPGMRVLDLGAGKGASSIFLAREYDVRVVATDWRSNPEKMAAAVAEAGVADRVEVVSAEPHALPFEEESFDAVVSAGAFEYFGTSDGYLPYLLQFLRPGGQLGMATPALTREIRELGEIPAHIKAAVGWEAIAWHTAEWWRFQWEITGMVTVTSARLQDDAWRDWLLWTEACAEYVQGQREVDHSVIDMLNADGGKLLSFAFVTARKN